MNIRSRICGFIRATLVIGALIAGGFVAPDAHGQVGGPYSKFGPVNGILKGSVSTYNTSAAASTDVSGLFCSSSASLFLRADGTCAIPTGTGVTSVSQTVPAGFAIAGSPVTTSGTLAISYATGQSANLFLATPNGTTGALSERAIVGADLPPINLGSTANGGVSGASILLGTNGGTSNGFFSVTGPATALRTFTFPNASATVLTDNAAVTVAQGGTGLPTLTAHGVLLGEGTSAVSPLVMGADTVLRGTASADPVAAAVPNCGSGTTALNYNTTTHAFGCQTLTGGSAGVTSVTAGTGLTASPNPIIATGTVSLDLTANNAWTGNQTWIQTNTGTYESLFQNPSTGVAAVTRLTIKNSADSFLIANTSTAFSGSFMTGGSSGESANIETAASVPINLGVGGAARFSMNNAASGRQFDVIGTTNTSSAVAYMGITDQAGVRYGYWGKSGSGTQVSYESDNAVAVVANNGADTISIDGSHNMAVGGSITSMAVAAPVTSTVFRTISGATSIGASSATTVATLPNTGTGTYFVSCAVSGGSGTSQSVAGFVLTNTTNATLTSLGSTSGVIAVTMSGLNLQCTQTIGGTQSVSWSYTRWGS